MGLFDRLFGSPDPKVVKFKQDKAQVLAVLHDAETTVGFFQRSEEYKRIAEFLNRPGNDTVAVMLFARKLFAPVIRSGSRFARGK